MSVIIGPVLPPVLAHHRPVAAGEPSPARRSVPLPTLIVQRTSPIVYGVAALDCHGRVADRTVMHALGWSAGLRLHIGEHQGVLTASPDPTGPVAVIRPGHFRLPAPLRHRCGLETGDRVLLAADPACSRLMIYPPATLDDLLPWPNTTAGGEQV
jgi:hypothetical protein